MFGRLSMTRLTAGGGDVFLVYRDLSEGCLLPVLVIVMIVGL